MAINVDQLREGLTDYRQSLTREQNELREQFENLRTAWLALNEVYEGQSAEEFRHAWGETAEWFGAFFEELGSLEEFLETRAEKLKRL